MRTHASAHMRRGITVLGLLLLIVALMVAGFFLVRYLRTRQAVTQSPVSLLQEPFDELNLTGVIQVVSSNPVDLLRVGPPALG